MNEYRLQSLVILIGQICLLSCISPDSKINENEKNVQAVVTDIPKTKVVGGRLFNYVEPRYEYRDEPGQWYIFERPKGIFTYWYKEGQYDGNRIGAFKIDFYSDTILIKSIDLASLNPYTKSRYPNLSSKIFESTGDSHSNFPRPVGKVISEYARKAYTYSNIRESDQNYIIVDFVFMGYDQNNGFINQEHTFIVFDNFGTEIARIEHIENFISDPVITHRGRYFTYLINNDTENLNRLIVLDLISKKELFNSDKDEPRFTFGEPRTLSKDQNSVAPYIDTDSCYVMLEVHRKGPDIMSQCDIIPFYLDIENRINYFGCCAKLDWGKWNFPSQHYKIIEQSSANSKKF